MSRRRIGIYGLHEESLRLTRLLDDGSDVDIVRFYEPAPDAAIARARELGRSFARQIEERLVDDLDDFVGTGDLYAVVDDGQLENFLTRRPDVRDRDIQVVSPLTARLLWAYGSAPRDRKAELLQALGEVVESVELTIDSGELFNRMLEIAVGVTGAEGGSLMLLDDARHELYIQVAIGVEPELWQKIRVPLGEGISGYVADTARPLHIEGKADRRHFQITRERMDVEAALCVPLVFEGKVLGVLNLHHSTRSHAFSPDDLHFLEQLAALDAQIIHRAQEHETLRFQAARYEAVREISSMLAGPAPLSDRLQNICKSVADRMGNGIANIYLCDPERNDSELLLTATSLAGGGFGGEYRVVVGQGVDGGAAESRRPIFLSGERGSIAYAALPLLVADRLVGVLAAQAGPSPPQGRAAEEGLLEIAAAVAEGVSRSWRESHIRARATRMSAINETGVRMLSATDAREVARLATSSLAMILDADHAILRLQDPKTRRYKMASYYGSADEALQPQLFALDKQTSVEAIQQRTAILVRDLAHHSTLSEFDGDFSSLISSPIKVDGQVVGTISIYDKVAIDRFFVGRFTEEDLQVFAKFVSYVERALSNAQVHSEVRELANFDRESGLPNESYLASRTAEEIARADGTRGTLALAVCSIVNWDQLLGAYGPAHGHRVVEVVVGALRETLRDFDVLGRLDTQRFAFLLPEPGNDIAGRVSELARSVADHIRQDDALNEEVRVELAFGYALHPAEGGDFEALADAASEPRIETV
ncbi:MAG: GAF domain-containing protein [Deltaproteobacteria bacterium]|nr:GAF domain-containing protein [Deltaproteobacteria bacterium]